MAILILTEKPSVAQSIAKAIGVTVRKDGYLEGADCFISWCVGHLVEFAAADHYDSRYSNWTQKDLPILPDPWQYVVSPITKKQFDIIKSLMERPDVTELIEATDAGREGELIFRLVYQQAGCKKPFKRLWISSMEDTAIKEGFQNLFPGKKYDALYEAALCRAKADWLIGINATRLFTTLYGGKTLNIGRVMTPTLALLTEREQEIAKFQKKKFYIVELDFGVFHGTSKRFSCKTDAEKLRKSCLGKTATVQAIERKEKSEKPPKLYDLTTLQREANRLYGYTAQQTLDYIQILYEKKLITYPRTDSRYLTEDMAAGLPALCQSVAESFPFTSEFSGTIQVEQVIDNAKVSDHHAILPTKGLATFRLEELPTGEKNLLALLAVRLLCAVCPDNYRYADTIITISCNDVEFTIKEHVEIFYGWKKLEQAFHTTLKEKTAKNITSLLPEIIKGQKLTVEDAVLREGTTSPPIRYTEDSLLSAMQNAGTKEFAQIEDVERMGLGTPATRAGVIEKLIKGEFVERKNKFLLPTKRGMELIKVLPDTIKSVKLTTGWEAALKEIECGKRMPKDFLDEIIDMVCELTKSYENVNIGTKSPLSSSDKEVIGICPRCGKEVYEGKKSFYCSGYKGTPSCGFALWKDNLYFKSKRKELTKKIVATLLKNGKIQMTGLYSEKKDILYDATIVMVDTGEKYVNFKLEFDQKK